MFSSMNSTRILSIIFLLKVCVIILAETPEKREICLSEACEELSKSMLERIDAAVWPCENFYEYACGNYGNQNVNDEHAKSNFRKFENFFESTSGATLNEILTSVMPAKVFHTSCKQYKKVENKGPAFLKTHIRLRYHGWPVAIGKNWDSEKKWDIIQTIGTMAEYGLDASKALFTVTIEPEAANSTRHSLYIRRPTFAVDGLMHENPKPYFDFMVDTAVILGATKDAALSEMSEVLHFERELALLSDPLRGIVLLEEEQTIKISQLQIAYPYFDWLQLIRYFVPSDYKIDKNDSVYFDYSSYFQHLGMLLKRTPNRTIANYLVWRVVFFFSEHLTEELYNRRLQFEGQFYGKSRLKHLRRDNCLATTKKYLHMSFVAVYSQHSNLSHIAAVVPALVGHIVDELNLMYYESEWLYGYDYRQTAEIEKLQRIQTIIEESNHSNYYDKLKLNEKNFFGNLLLVLQFDESRKREKLRPLVQKEDFFAAFPNGFYDSSSNKLYIPATLLIPSSLNVQLPLHLLYGELGTKIGSALARTLADRRHWSQNSGFSRKVKCFEKYTNNENIFRKKTVDEYIADNMGITAALRAHQKELSKDMEKKLLPNIEHKERELFWISAAQLFCSEDVHSPNKHRVNVMVQNMKEFPHDFGCTSGENMHPLVKC